MRVETMANGRRGNGNSGPRRVGKGRRRSPRLQAAIDNAVRKMQQSPYIRFILPEEKMRAAIDNKLFRRGVAKRRKQMSPSKRAFRYSVQRACEMDYKDVMRRSEEIDKEIKLFHKKLDKAHLEMFQFARLSREMTLAFEKAARSYLLAGLHISQIKQHDLAYEMTIRMHERQQLDPQVFREYEKEAMENYAEEKSAVKRLANIFAFRRWCQKEFVRLKKL